VKNLCKLLPISLLILISVQNFAQKKIILVEDRTSPIVEKFYQLLKEMPKEVLFGVEIYDNGEVYVSMTNRDWFNKLFTLPKDGIAIDLVKKDYYACSKSSISEGTWQRGEWTIPIYVADIKKKIVNLGNGEIKFKVGIVPQHLRNKEIEGNLGMLKNGKLAYYEHFISIPQNLFHVLPMGLFAENHLKYEKDDSKDADSKPTIYSKKIQFIIPFQKNKFDYNSADIQPLYDSLKLTDYKIRKIEIRAYSSVEGGEDINRLLQIRRSEAIIKVLQHFQNTQILMEINTAENWLEFSKDIQNTPFEYLSSLRHPDIKSKLMDKDLASQLEPILQNHRKAITTIYLEKKTGYEEVKYSKSLVKQFNNAIQANNFELAGGIQKEIFDRIYDNQLPSDFLNQLEILQTKSCLSLLNNQGVYLYLISVKKKENVFQKKDKNVSSKLYKLGNENYEYDLKALNFFQKYQKIDPENNKINYNICSLKFNLWEYDSTIVSSKDFWDEIMKVRKSGEIDVSLARRMILNFHILMSEQHQSRFEYDLKDKSVDFVSDKYKDLALDDSELYALAQYLVYYSRIPKARELVLDRLDQLNTDENLLFYYINLMFFKGNPTSDHDFTKAIDNAVSINKTRFCHFYDVHKKGGAGIGLFEDRNLRVLYCSFCEK
jgi:hypothetical protein